MTRLHRALATLLLAPALLVPGAGATAQDTSGSVEAAAEAEPPLLPGEICLTNACSDPLKRASLPKSVPQAVAAGNAIRVRELGGSPVDAIQAMKVDYQRLNLPPERVARMIGQLEAFADTSGGARLVFEDAHTGQEMKFVGTGGDAGPLQWGIDRYTPDGMVQTISPLPSGGLFFGAPRRPDPR